MGWGGAQRARAGGKEIEAAGHAEEGYAAFQGCHLAWT
mgnify:CR=1 FL=1